MVELDTRLENCRGLPPAKERAVSPCASVIITTASDFPSATVEGLLHGGLLGPGLRITKCEPGHVAAAQQLVGSTRPDAVEFLRTPEKPSELRVNLWCRRMRRRCALQAVALGGVVGLTLALLAGWLVVLTAPCAALAAIGYDWLAWRARRGNLVRRLQLYFTNYSRTQPGSSTR